ncbi:MAG: discoidin domain-containing protein [Prevotellaceae bacterium]|nr:discoidin domain-containing protein [Candidatus Faecinaster equi]
MRKILLLLVLMLSIGTMWNTSKAGWILGDRVDIFQGYDESENYIIMPIANGTFDGRYVTTHPKTGVLQIGTPNVIDEYCIWNFEEGPENASGAPTVYIRQHVTGKYIVPFTANWDGFKLAEDVVEAANYQILSCGQDIPWANTIAWSEERMPGHEDDEVEIANWRINVNTGEKTADDESVGFAFYDVDDEGDPAYCYLGIWNGPQCLNWSYTDTNQWNIYKAIFIEDYQGDLSEYVDQCSNEFNPVGDGVGDVTPGFYVSSYVEAYYSALEWAILASLMDDMGNDFYISAMNDLKQAREACEDSMIPLTEGYYRFVSAYEGFINNDGVEKAAYADETQMIMGWNTLDENDPSQVFKLTKAEAEDEWSVQCFGNDLFVGGQTNWYASRTSVTDGLEELQNIRWRLEGMWFWGSHSEHKTSLCPDPFSGEKGKMYTWGQWGDSPYTDKDHKNLWYLRHVSDAEIAALLPIKEQAERNKEMTALKTEATKIYNNLFAFTTLEDSLIIGEDQFTSNSPLTEETTFANLIDGDSISYCHTSSSVSQPYYQIDLSATPVSVVTFKYDKRRGNEQQSIWGEEERPATVSIYATNDTTGGGTWTKVIESYQADMPLPVEWSCNLGAEYKYVRFVAEINKRGDNVFTLGSFQMYNAEFDKANSQYYTVEGMQAAADNMIATKEEKDAIENVTEQDVTEMRDALAAVKALYADTAAVRELIDECKVIADGITIGEEIGELSEDNASLKDALDIAIADAEETIVNYADNKAKLDEATSALTNAKAALLGGITFIEEGKWYFITNADAERSGEPGAEDSWCSGNVIYASDAYTTSTINWGFYDPESSELTTVNDPSTMWTFKKVEGTDYYYVQNMITGIYLGACAGASAVVTNSAKPVPYAISFVGNRQFTLSPVGATNKKNLVLYAAGGEKSQVTCESKKDAYTAGAWTFTEVTEDLTGGAIVINKFAYNLIDVFAVPFAHEDLAEYNDGCHWYRIKSMIGDEESGYTSAILTEGTSFEAGESSIYIGGELEDEFVDGFEITVPMPETVVDKAWSGVQCNGILGKPNGGNCPAGSGISTGKVFYPLESESGCGALTGVINPGDYQGEQEGSADMEITFKSALKNPTAVKSLKKNTTVKNVIGVNAVAGKSIVPGVYIQENGKKVVE